MNTSQQKFSSYFIKSTMSPFLQKNRDSSSKLYPESTNIKNLDISIDTIIFYYRGNHSQNLYNRELRLKNNTGRRIHFKIKSTSPENYEVLPFEEDIQNGKSCEIRIKLSVSGTSINKYNVDRFQILWGQIKGKMTQNALLKVRMETESSKEQLFTEEDMHKTSLEKENIVYKEILDKNEEQIKALNEKIKILENVNPREYEVNFCFLFVIGLIFFLVGYGLT